MPAIITDTFDYNDIVRVLDLDEAFVHHQIDALQPKYWRVVIKTKPQGLKIFAPVMVSGNRGIDYMIYMLSRDWQITKKQRLLDYMYFGVYRLTDGFHLVGFMYLDSNPLAKPEKAFFTPHFFDRYRERTGLPMDMPKMDVMKDWIMKNLHLNPDAQGNEKYPDGIFCAYPSGVIMLTTTCRTSIISFSIVWFNWIASTRLVTVPRCHCFGRSLTPVVIYFCFLSKVTRNSTAASFVAEAVLCLLYTNSTNGVLFI